MRMALYTMKRIAWAWLAACVLPLTFAFVLCGCQVRRMSRYLPEATNFASPSPTGGLPPTPLRTSPTDTWALWTTGTQLRGANIYQRRVYPELDGPTFMGPGPFGPPLMQADFDALAALGANYVNLSHPGLFTETAPYTVDLEAQANLDSLLTMAAQADMFAVITFRTGPGRSEFWAFWGEDTAQDPDGWFDPDYYDNRVWGDQAAQDAWVEMWRYTAQRYKDNPIVVGYDLMCEPNSNEVGSYPLGPALDVWDPDEFYAVYGGTLYDWNQLYPRIVTAIRQVDQDTPILVGGMGYSAVEWLPYLEPVSDTHTLYTIHQYAPFSYTHQEPDTLTYTYPGTLDLDWDGTPDTFNRDWLDGYLATVDTFVNTHGVPVAVNELGVHRWAPGGDAFLDDQLSLLEQRGLNYALWEWATSYLPFASEVDAFNFRHGPDPDHHSDISSSLQSVVVAHWAQNTARPSRPITFTPVATIHLPLVARYTATSTSPLAMVNDFLYQLQDLDLTAIGNSAYDLVVMDYSADGGETGEFTATQIDALRHSPGGEKIVLAYMSIGEAEDYRFYWQDGWEVGDPAWLDAENPDWSGNYKVRYWDPAWQTIILSYTDRLLNAGFDGAYLDIIDAYEYYSATRPTAAQDMADFVARIRAYARARDPDFLVFPQNAAELARIVPGYLDVVDGIGQEDIYYGYEDDDVMTPPTVTAALEANLDLFRYAGKCVLTVDYATTPAHIDDAYAKSQAKGYIPFVTVRDLDQLTINPGHEPD